MSTSSKRLISLNTAASITGTTKRTLWRRIADGRLIPSEFGGGVNPSSPRRMTLVELEQVLPWTCMPLSQEDQALILAADAGEAEAQCDLGLLLLSVDRPADALYWLRLAAKRYYPEAMFWLGRCLIAGTGVDADEEGGRKWLEQAAAHGHQIAGRLVAFLNDPAARLACRAVDPVSTEAALDALEREWVLGALANTHPPA